MICLYGIGTKFDETSSFYCSADVSLCSCCALSERQKSIIITENYEISETVWFDLLPVHHCRM